MTEPELGPYIESEILFRMLLTMAQMPQDQQELLRESGKQDGDQRFHRVKRTSYLPVDDVLKCPGDPKPKGVEVTFTNSHECDYQQRDLDFFEGSFTIALTNNSKPKSEWPIVPPGGPSSAGIINHLEYDDQYKPWTNLLLNIAKRADFETCFGRASVGEVSRTTEWAEISGMVITSRQNRSDEITLGFKASDRDKIYNVLRNYYEELTGNKVDDRLLEALKPAKEKD